MAESGEINLDVLNEAVSTTLERIDEKWYRKSPELVKFLSMVKKFQDLHSSVWGSIVEKFGPARDEVLMSKIGRAQSLMTEHNLDAKKLHSSLWRTLIGGIAFPSSLTEAVEEIICCIDIRLSIISILETKKAEQERILGEIAPLTFNLDEAYVPLIGSMNEVRMALETQDDDRIVVLYGEPGTGKTCLAKYLALLYTGILHRNESDQYPKMFRDGVVYLNCGETADDKVLLAQLCRNLGLTTLINKADSALDLKKLLANRLQTLDILIVLNDVWETSFVEDIVVEGKGVKYLLISRRATVCPAHLGHVQVQMSKPSLEEARQIFANHAEGFEKTIPPHWKDFLENLSEASNLNPAILANASVALAVRPHTELDDFKWITSGEANLDGTEVFYGPFPIMFGSSYSADI